MATRLGKGHPGILLCGSSKGDCRWKSDLILENYPVSGSGSWPSPDVKPSIIISLLWVSRHVGIVHEPVGLLDDNDRSSDAVLVVA